MAEKYPKPKELDNWKGEDPRIDAKEPMSVDGFRATMLTLGSIYPDDEDVQKAIREQLAWAEGLQEDAVIRWVDDNGVTKPVVIHSLGTINRISS